MDSQNNMSIITHPDVSDPQRLENVSRSGLTTDLPWNHQQSRNMLEYPLEYLMNINSTAGNFTPLALPEVLESLDSVATTSNSTNNENNVIKVENSSYSMKHAVEWLIIRDTLDQQCILTEEEITTLQMHLKLISETNSLDFIPFDDYNTLSDIYNSVNSSLKHILHYKHMKIEEKQENSENCLSRSSNKIVTKSTRVIGCMCYRCTPEKSLEISKSLSTALKTGSSLDDKIKVYKTANHFTLFNAEEWMRINNSDRKLTNKDVNTLKVHLALLDNTDVVDFIHFDKYKNVSDVIVDIDCQLRDFQGKKIENIIKGENSGSVRMLSKNCINQSTLRNTRILKVLKSNLKDFVLIRFIDEKHINKGFKYVMFQAFEIQSEINNAKAKGKLEGNIIKTIYLLMETLEVVNKIWEINLPIINTSYKRSKNLYLNDKDYPKLIELEFQTQLINHFTEKLKGFEIDNDILIAAKTHNKVVKMLTSIVKNDTSSFNTDLNTSNNINSTTNNRYTLIHAAEWIYISNITKHFYPPSDLELNTLEMHLELLKKTDPAYFIPFDIYSKHNSLLVTIQRFLRQNHRGNNRIKTEEEENQLTEYRSTLSKNYTLYQAQEWLDIRKNFYEYGAITDKEMNTLEKHLELLNITHPKKFIPFDDYIDVTSLFTCIESILRKLNYDKIMKIAEKEKENTTYLLVKQKEATINNIRNTQGISLRYINKQKALKQKWNEVIPVSFEDDEMIDNGFKLVLTLVDRLESEANIALTEHKIQRHTVKIIYAMKELISTIYDLWDMRLVSPTLINKYLNVNHLIEDFELE